MANSNPPSMLDTTREKLRGMLGEFPQGFNTGATAGFPGYVGDMAYLLDAIRLALSGERSQKAPEEYPGTTEAIAQAAGMPVPKSLSGQLGMAVGGMLSPSPTDLLKFAPVLAAIPAFKSARAASALDDLPMDEASRMARAREMGFDVDTTLYHGTTHDVQQFGGGNYELGSHFGGADYFTTSPHDASKNYAGEGPDLTQRIQLYAERLASERDADYNDPEILAEARRALKGENDGTVMPVYTRAEKPFRPDDNTLYLGTNDPPLNMEDFPDEDAYYEALDAVEPTGPLVDFIASIQRQADDYGFDATPVVERLQEAMWEGGISHKKLDEVMRNTEWYAESPDTGDLLNNDVYRQALQDAGFDSVDMDATAPKWNMDIPQGTRHVVMFDPKKIRSKWAKFDPKNKDSANILAGAAGLGLGGMLWADYEKQKRKGMLD